MLKIPKFIIKILMPVMSKITPSCETVTQKISESMDHPISFGDRFRIRIHLMGCELCARYKKQLYTIRKMIKSHLAEINDSATVSKLSTQARQRMKQKIKENSKP